MTHKKIQQEIDYAINQLGQALCNADWFNNGVIEKDRVWHAMQTLMRISNSYPKIKSKK